MLCHATDAFGCPLGERVPPPIRASPIPVPIYKWLAPYLPRKWPHGVPAPPEMNQQIAGAPPADFAADHATLIARVDRFARCSGPWSPHPFFGSMAASEWMRWGYLHSDHHRQFGR
jgi:hypothetical protein